MSKKDPCSNFSCEYRPERLARRRLVRGGCRTLDMGGLSRVGPHKGSLTTRRIFCRLDTPNHVLNGSRRPRRFASCIASGMGRLACG